MMEQKYEISFPKKVYCGQNSIEKIYDILLLHSGRVGIFTDNSIRSLGLLNPIIEQIKKATCDYVIFSDIKPEPTSGLAKRIIQEYLDSNVNLIIAVGGGSVMDIAKLASISNKSYSVTELLKDTRPAKKQVPTIMIPTTAGTGSEATPNSIVLVEEKQLKVGIVSLEMMADYIILDGQMILNLPEPVAASTGIDALSHCIECYTSNKANPISNMFALEGIKLIFDNLVKACQSKDAMKEKNNMLLAAYYGGMAITASGTTAVHALSYPLGGKYHIPHGVANAIMLLPVMKFNQEACSNEFIKIFDTIQPNTELEKEEKIQELLKKISNMIKTLNIPTNLKQYHITESDVNILVSEGMSVTRLLNNNKRLMTAEDARRLYEEIL